eukprot:12400697-Karenia_brevis.AAC.1
MGLSDRQPSIRLGAAVRRKRLSSTNDHINCSCTVLLAGRRSQRPTRCVVPAETRPNMLLSAYNIRPRMDATECGLGPASTILSTDWAMSSTLPGLLPTMMTPSLHLPRFTRAPRVTNS